MSKLQTASQEFSIDESDLLVLVGNQASQTVYANPAYARALGYELAELKGQPAAKTMHPGNPMQLIADMTLSIRAKKPWTGIIKSRHKNGNYCWLRLNVAPIFSKGRFAGSLMVHSKPSAQEIARVEPLYKRMLDGQHKKLMLRNGHEFTANAMGKALLWVRESGLKGRIWGACAALGLVGLAGLLMADARGAAFWIAALLMVGGSALVGLYLTRNIVQPLRNAVRFANQISAGDLSSHMASNRSDEIGDVIRALTQMNVNMRATVRDVRDGVGVMSLATAEIAAGNQHLSDRTESQSQQLVQTATAMEEMTATVHNNSEIARQASRMATDASQAAEKGGQVVSAVISTMDGIAKSSQQIAEIIGVIDGIAFQTNILALNAAVEAARAGEQGRGFAVVASEVRSLAQRSATSAKEIRTLISDSVGQVGNGTTLVHQAGQTIGDVVNQVRKVTELVSQIASASSEQSSGLGQINQAVAVLDEMTQQNAALVEESTASSASLREQAQGLVDVVQVFKLTPAETEAFYNSIDAATAKAIQRKSALEAGLKG